MTVDKRILGDKSDSDKHLDFVIVEKEKCEVVWEVKFTEFGD